MDSLSLHGVSRFLFNSRETTFRTTQNMRFDPSVASKLVTVDKGNAPNACEAYCTELAVKNANDCVAVAYRRQSILISAVQSECQIVSKAVYDEIKSKTIAGKDYYISVLNQIPGEDSEAFLDNELYADQYFAEEGNCANGIFSDLKSMSKVNGNFFEGRARCTDRGTNGARAYIECKGQSPASAGPQYERVMRLQLSGRNSIGQEPGEGVLNEVKILRTVNDFQVSFQHIVDYIVSKKSKKAEVTKKFYQCTIFRLTRKYGEVTDNTWNGMVLGTHFCDLLTKHSKAIVDPKDIEKCYNEMKKTQGQYEQSWKFDDSSFTGMIGSSGNIELKKTWGPPRRMQRVQLIFNLVKASVSNKGKSYQYEAALTTSYSNPLLVGLMAATDSDKIASKSKWQKATDKEVAFNNIETDTFVFNAIFVPGAEHEIFIDFSMTLDGFISDDKVGKARISILDCPLMPRVGNVASKTITLKDGTVKDGVRAEYKCYRKSMAEEIIGH